MAVAQSVPSNEALARKIHDHRSDLLNRLDVKKLLASSSAGDDDHDGYEILRKVFTDNAWQRLTDEAKKQESSDQHVADMLLDKVDNLKDQSMGGDELTRMGLFAVWLQKYRPREAQLLKLQPADTFTPSSNLQEKDLYKTVTQRLGRSMDDNQFKKLASKLLPTQEQAIAKACKDNLQDLLFAWCRRNCYNDATIGALVKTLKSLGCFDSVVLYDVETILNRSAWQQDGRYETYICEIEEEYDKKMREQQAPGASGSQGTKLNDEIDLNNDAVNCLCNLLDRVEFDWEDFFAELKEEVPRLKRRGKEQFWIQNESPTRTLLNMWKNSVDTLTYAKVSELLAAAGLKGAKRKFEEAFGK